MNPPGRKPDWLRVKAFSGNRYDEVNQLLRKHHLNTVCQAANCPNRGECFNRGTATFLILGPVCTRNCRFCDVPSGIPAPVDHDEPSRVAALSAELHLKHVVITSVTRDDLPDGGAEQFAMVVRELRKAIPSVTVEVLTPDFRDKPAAADVVIDAAPDIFNHNLETVRRLYPEVRPGADYFRSLDLLRYVREHSDIVTKSGIMVGLGETVAELGELFRDLSHTGVSNLTIGQYLSPSKDHLPVNRYLHPDEFDMLRELALQAGIKNVFSAPLVRSSYKADLFAS